MTGVDGLTGGSISGGIYRVRDDVSTIVATVTGAGWSAAVVEPAEGTAALYDHLASALDLPDWFGRNLDALWDVVTDLDRPTALIMVDWTRYARARPGRWQLIMDVFAERCTREPPFALVLASANPSPTTSGDTSWNSD